MEIINRRQRMFSISRKLRREDKTVGFVPTMGALHEGIWRWSKRLVHSAMWSIVSIFVNPAAVQRSGRSRKISARPDGRRRDCLPSTRSIMFLLRTPSEIYPDGFSTYVDVEGLTETLEGASRPGHFRGVATVVTILFNTIRPDLAFFGQKDAQQVAVIKRLTTDLGFETEIVVVPTVREESGLAMSSRNALLSTKNGKRRRL